MSGLKTFTVPEVNLKLHGWISSVDPEEKKKVQENAAARDEATRQSSTLTSLVNGEKFVKLFQSVLYEEETLGTELESIEDKIYKLKIASKELKRVHIVIDSLKTQVLYNFFSPIKESRRIQNLFDKFEHTKTYIELRRYMLNKAQMQLSMFTKKGMALKIWLSEAQEFQEKLHSANCDTSSDIEQHSSLLLGIRKDCEVIRLKLAKYEHLAQSLTGTLMEMSLCSGIFHKALERSSSQNGKRKWHDTLAVSVTEEVTQVAQRFSTFTKLNECYQAHLDGLQRSLKV